MSRRAHISLETKLAAALLTLGDVPYEHAKQMSARQIISLYQWDHYPVLKAHDGPDEPWNLVPRLIRPHREKSRRDTSVAAKVKRLAAANGLEARFRKPPIGFSPLPLVHAADAQNAISGPPKRKIAARANPWPKGRKFPKRRQSANASVLQRD